MNVSDYFESLSSELTALKNRVRHIIEDSHWQTDGEWKESVLRSILRRHLPRSVEVGRGFVIEPQACSHQIDVLVYDAAKPVLYRDGDLVFITSDAVKGIIEVKSRVQSIDALRRFVNKLADNAKFINSSRDCWDGDDDLFVGLFAYESQLGSRHSEAVLDALQSDANGNEHRLVNHVSLGSSLFIRFWRASSRGEYPYNRWHSYHLQDKAPGYFINNVVDTVARRSVRRNQEVWFPLEGKENYKLDEMPFSKSTTQ